MNSGNSFGGQPGARATYVAAAMAHRQGRLGDAERGYETSLRIDRNHFESLHNLGFIRLQQGRLEEARSLLRRATQQRPRSAVAHNNLGLALDKLGFKEQALARFEKALQLDPNLAEAHNNLGAAFEKTRPEDAIRHLEKAVALRPDYAEAHNNLGSAWQTLRLADKAIAHFRRAVEVHPDFALAEHNLGRALDACLRFEEALPHYQRAVALRPDMGPAWSDLGKVLGTLGRPDAARQAFETALKLEPGQTAYYLPLANVKRFSTGDLHLAAMEKIALNASALSDVEKVNLDFALGKAYADIGNHERSFHHLQDGNALKRRLIAYNEREMLDAFARIRAAFTSEIVGSHAGSGDPSDAPVFVLGMPRSGSTLTEQILASHPNVFAAGEIGDFLLSVEALREQQGLDVYPEMAAALTGDRVQALGADYAARVAARASDARRITDKLPENFLYVGLIHLALPNARIIHTRRNPIDTCLSCFSNLFIEGNLPYTYDLGELGRYYSAYDELMAHWRSVLPEGAMLEVQYEALVADLEGEARRIVSHCGLEWDDRCLAFHEAQRPVKTSSNVQVRQPLYGSSVGRWKPYERFLEPLVDALGPLAPSP